MTHIPSKDQLADERREDAEEMRRLRKDACQCGGDMPGRCPGPEACPLAYGQELEDEG
ncbi:MAG: hypothetical protein KGJ73_03885 [Rhodospirillales bacterium]|nr:hypothetical protein [Rhodospirillales bacterium]